MAQAPHTRLHTHTQRNIIQPKKIREDSPIRDDMNEAGRHYAK